MIKKLIALLAVLMIISGCVREDKKTAAVKDFSISEINSSNNLKELNPSSKEEIFRDIEIRRGIKVKIEKTVTLNSTIFQYLSSEKNRNSVAKRANELHGGNLHDSCVYYASEALRRIGIRMDDSMCAIPEFMKELKSSGFRVYKNLNDLKPGDICFTTDVNGVYGGRPTHTYIFMGWEAPGVARIVDNQLYDYGDVYHTRFIKFHYLNGDKSKPKEATAFFMRKE